MIPLQRRDGRPLRIGHRGAAALAPENTLASFRTAVAAGVDLIEFDVVRLRQGQLVVAHSNDLHEVSHGRLRGSLADLPFAELRAAVPELPTLDEALAFFVDEAPATGAHLDLKSEAGAQAAADAVARHGLVDRAFLSSFHRAALRRLAHSHPGLRLGVSFPRDRLGLGGRRRLWPLVELFLTAGRALMPALVRPLLSRSRAHTCVVHHTVVSARLVRRAHALGAPVVAWTVDEPDDLLRVAEAGVDAVVTNDPSIFVSTLTA